MSRDHEAHEAAILFRLAARTPEEKTYFRGYVSGVSRRIAGGIGTPMTDRWFLPIVCRGMEMAQSIAV